MKTRRKKEKRGWPERRFGRLSTREWRGEERERFFDCWIAVVPWWIYGSWICEGRRRRREEKVERKLKIEENKLLFYFLFYCKGIFFGVKRRKLESGSLVMVWFGSELWLRKLNLKWTWWKEPSIWCKIPEHWFRYFIHFLKFIFVYGYARFCHYRAISFRTRLPPLLPGS